MKNDELQKIIMHDAKEMESYIIQTRRYIHMHPETLYEEENTATFIEEELNKIGIETQRIIGTGVLATINGPSTGKVVALRADIDALNIIEETPLSYKSQYKGKMHACGHDAHAAMLLSAAKIIFNHRDYLLGNVKLIFQPAEEGGGGAKKIIDEGHFNNIDRVFGMHVWSSLSSGIIGLRKGPVFASSDRFQISIIGEGGHAAAPHQTVDPTSVMVDIYNALLKLVSREVDPFERCVLSLPVFEASDAHNIIPTIAKVKGTLRTMNPEVRNHLMKRIKEVVEGFSAAWRCKAKVKFNPMAYPTVINDDKTVDALFEILRTVSEIQIMDQTMIAEDFAFYLQKTNGAFMTLGIRNEAKGIIFPHHHPQFQVDESILWNGTALYAILGFFYSFHET